MGMWSPFYQVTDSERTCHLIEIAEPVTSGGEIRTRVSEVTSLLSQSLLYGDCHAVQRTGSESWWSRASTYVTLLHYLEHYYLV